MVRRLYRTTAWKFGSVPEVGQGRSIEKDNRTCVIKESILKGGYLLKRRKVIIIICRRIILIKFGKF